MNKIILIDDNKSNQREIYGATFVDNGEFEDCLIHKEELNENSDFSFLDDAACVLLHDSLADYVDGKFVPGSRMAKECVTDKIKADKIPYVVFSDGHSVIGDWSQTNPNVVRSIKKSEFYRNLKGFLEAYREFGTIDLRLIAYGNEFEKRELVYLLQQIFDELHNSNDKETLTLSSVNTDLLERFFVKISHVSNNITFEKLCDSINAGKLTVGKFKAYINSLASHAIKYTALVPKQNILLLGNDLSRERMSDISNVTFKPLNTFQLGEKGEKEMFDNISSCVPSNVDAIIIDVDSTKTPDACLSYALAIRLSLHEKKTAALAPIIFMSSLTPDIFKNSPYSTMLQTKGISFESPLYTPTAVELMVPLTPEDYRPYFLDLIKVKPNSTEGRHSLANQWGANVLNRALLGCDLDNPVINRAKHSLYFKYILALTYKPQQISSFIYSNNDNDNLPSAVEDLPNAANTNILLIDDEAEKGWAIVLSDICKGANFELSQKRVNNFNDLDEDIRNKIKNDYYDLIFLDLRLNGLNEEDIKRPEDFSGVKILQKIKDINRGTQVIILTASNKAWNMKILLESGADGYYIKESPEYAFPLSYSEKNAETLLDEIDICLERGYLKLLYRKIERLKNQLSDTIFSESTTNRIIKQLDVSYFLLDKARTKEEFAYSYITLEAVFEIISEELLEKKNKREYEINVNAETCRNWELRNKWNYESDCYDTKTPSLNDYPTWKRISSIYYQLLNGKDPFYGSRTFHLIEARNAFIHNDKLKQNEKIRLKGEKKAIYKDIFNKDGFVRLFDTIYELIVLIANSLS
ncbi:MAG: response regulator [Muribaculaceae bacterium]|nr:response regulator [Muribaculaceae bacterium]